MLSLFFCFCFVRIHIGYNVECVKSTPSNYFWYRETLNITPDIEISGSLNWRLVICLAGAWSVVYICLIKGISSIGKVCAPGEKDPFQNDLNIQVRCKNKELTRAVLYASGCVCDRHIPIPGADHFPDPCPHSAGSNRWTIVPLHP